MNEFLNHWFFIEPECYLDILNIPDCFPDDIRNVSDGLPKEWIKIFFIARCLFSMDTAYPIKGRMAPILERNRIFEDNKVKEEIDRNDMIIDSELADNVDIGKVTSTSQILHILPREFLINTEDLFYKKLINHELYRKKFIDPEGLSVSDLVYGKDKELNKRQKVYILFDNSCSMEGDQLNKLYAAKAICIEYLRRVRKESPQIYFRFFNQEMGQLQQITKSGQIKELIRYLINLHTVECYETKINEAILTAIKDIKNDPDMRQAEIIMITDGLGDIHADIKMELGTIKFHMILIAGVVLDRFLNKYPNWEEFLNLTKSCFPRVTQEYNLDVDHVDIDQFLKLYPCSTVWNNANVPKETPNMLPCWENFNKLLQIYRLQEVADIFVGIPSLFGERFKFSSAYELDLIEELRLNLAEKLEGELSNREKYEVMQRVRFLIKYLQILLTQEPTNEPPEEIKKRIKEEIAAFQTLLKMINADEWFTSSLAGRTLDLALKRREKGASYIATKLNKPWLFCLLLCMLNLFKEIPKGLARRVRVITKSARTLESRIHTKYRLKKKVNYINRRISRILAE
ncbi:MAG: hypothetical protein ACMUIL_00700 [bacterium]